MIFTHADLRRTANRPVLTQIIRDRASNIGRQRQPSRATAFLRTHGELSILPVEVIELQSDDFDASQPEPGQQQKNRAISPPNGRLLVARGQNPLNRFAGESFRQSSEMPVSDCRHRWRPIGLDLFVLE